MVPIRLAQKVWTNAYMYDRRYHHEVEDCVAYLDHLFHETSPPDGKSVPTDYELVIEIASSDTDDELLWQYYYVEHASRSIFWLEDHLLWKELEAVKGILSPDHICA